MINFGLAQINPRVGDLDYNLDLMRSYIKKAKDKGVQVLLFPELAISGYPPEDLLLRPHFIERAHKALRALACQVPSDMIVLAGTPHLEQTTLYNSLAILNDGNCKGLYHKMHLPNYGVFDEQRYFARGTNPGVINFNGITMGLSICEDIWVPNGPATLEAFSGAQIILNASASPYYRGKGKDRQRMLTQRALDNSATVIYCNLVGGQDELVFDGQSMVIDHQGHLLARGKQFEEDLITVSLPENGAVATRLRQPYNRAVETVNNSVLLADVHTNKSILPEQENKVEPELEPLPELYQALVLGTKDYLHKNGFKSAVLGLSGGIDSALVALIAVDALGKENVRCLVMPSTYSSNETQSDAETMAQNLGIQCDRVEIAPLMNAYESSLAPLFTGTKLDVTEENIQARIRGNLLMAVSNKFGSMVLTTGNKSEMSTGYFTIFGDAAGGFDCLADVPKLQVYALTEWRNKKDSLVPDLIITRPPSAELRPDQEDTDSLPPYEALDPIIECYVEQNLSRDEIVALGYKEEDVAKVIGLLDRSEYKRRMAPPGLKITSRAYGRDWRLPLTNGYVF